MNNGQHIPKDRRDAWAREAFQLFQLCGGVRARALEAIEDQFGVSNPTARNLLGRGRALAESTQTKGD